MNYYEHTYITIVVQAACRAVPRLAAIHEVQAAVPHHLLLRLGQIAPLRAGTPLGVGAGPRAGPAQSHPEHTSTREAHAQRRVHAGD